MSAACRTSRFSGLETRNRIGGTDVLDRRPRSTPDANRVEVTCPGLRHETQCSNTRRDLADLRTSMDGEGRRPFAHPAYWASLVLLGNSE